MTRRALAVVLVLMLAGTSGALAQTTIEDAISAYGEENAKGYLQPVADLFGANFNSGYYRTAKIPTAGFHISIDLIGMGSLVGDDRKTFTAKTPEGFNPPTFQAPTVFGDPDGATVVDNSTAPPLEYNASGGVFNTGMFPLVAPQLTIGSVYGTEVLGRYVSIPRVGGGDDIPEGSLWSVGIRHSVSQWFPDLPVDIAVGYFYGSFEAEDLLDYTGSQFGAQASKDFGILTAFTGIAYEVSTLKVSYESTDPQSGGQVGFELDGANVFRFTLGGTLNLGVFHLYADMNFGSVTAFSGGLGFTF